MNGVNLKNNKNFLEGMRLFEEERKIPAEFVIETLKERLAGEEKENASTHSSATSSK